MEITDKLIELAIHEDLPHGDITSENIIDKNHFSKAVIKAKEDLIICGQDVAARVFEKIDKRICIKNIFEDGEEVLKGKVVMEIQGPTISILKGERVALNFLQRLSGIATNTNKYVKKVKSTNIKILDTRKTTPAMRALEKMAVKCGGGYNHRMSLSDAVLIKDNHIDIQGSILEAIKRVRQRTGKGITIEVEVRNLREVREAVLGLPDIIMLDNMSQANIRKAVKIIKKEEKQIKVEISGGICLRNIKDYIIPGVDYISIGALTHEIKSSDLSLITKIC